MKIEMIPAKAVSYGGTRALSSVKGIVIHYTGVNNDTAINEAKYFANGNTRSAGAHFFVGQNGEVVQSIALERTAYSVGGVKYSDCSRTGGGKYYGTLRNNNTVSIELCDNLSKDPSDAQVDAARELIEHIKSKCVNAKIIVRHFDITGKACPARMTSASAWDAFLKRLNKQNSNGPEAKPAEKNGGSTDDKSKDGGYLVKITADVLRVRKSASAKSAVVTKVKCGEVYTIVSEKNGWGKLKSGAGWIYLRYTKRV